MIFTFLKSIWQGYNGLLLWLVSTLEKLWAKFAEKAPRLAWTLPFGIVSLYCAYSAWRTSRPEAVVVDKRWHILTSSELLLSTIFSTVLSLCTAVPALYFLFARDPFTSENPFVRKKHSDRKRRRKR